MSTYNPTKLEEGWRRVEDHLAETRLIAFDGCHKIYLALDEIEAEWFRANYEYTLADTPERMLAALREWFEMSCGLRFIQAVCSNPADPNAGYTSLIEQGAGWEDDDDEDDEDDE